MPRPRFEEEPQRRRNITLSDRLADIARELGEGNISVGIRRCLEGKIHTEPKPQAKTMGKKKASNVHTLPEIEAYKAQLREQMQDELFKFRIQESVKLHQEHQQEYQRKVDDFYKSNEPHLVFSHSQFRRLIRLSHPDAHPPERKRQCEEALHSLQDYERAVLSVLPHIPIAEARKAGWDRKHPRHRQSQETKARHKAKQKGQG